MADDGYPKPGARDHARQAMETAVSALPGIGGPGTELLEWILPASLERRRAAWFSLLDERLAGVEQQVFDDEAFHTAVLAATRSALGTHLEAKMRMLAEAVASCAAARNRGGFMVLRLLAWVDELEAEHFAVIGAIGALDRNTPTQVQWEDVIERTGLGDTWYLVLEDLTGRRLVGTTSYSHERPPEQYAGNLIWLEPFGDELADFVGIMGAPPAANHGPGHPRSRASDPGADHR